MDVKNLILGMVGIMICAVMIGGALLPAVASVTDDSVTVYNNEVGQYSSIIGDNINVEITDYVNMTIDGESITILDNYELPAIVTDKLLVKLDTNLNRNYIAYYSDTNGSVRVNDFTTGTIAISNNVATITIGSSTPVEIPITWGFIANNEGDYKSMWWPYNIYLNSIDQFYTCTWVSSTQKFLSAHGGKAFYEGEYLDAQYNLKPYKNTGDVYTMSKNSAETGDYSISVNNGGTMIDVFPYLCVVPASIEGTTDGYAGVGALISIIPLIAVAGLVMMGIYIFISRK